MRRQWLFLASLASPCMGACPAWIDNYILFHKSSCDRGALRLVYSAHPPRQTHMCGLGDHFRGMMWGLRAAASMNRCYFISMTQPLDLHLYMEPATFDWREPVSWWHAEVFADSDVLRGAVDYSGTKTLAFWGIPAAHALSLIHI